jgi:proton-dependent oligopeptide transporter, POT family
MSALGHNEGEVAAAAKVDNAQYAFSPVEKELGRGSVDAGRRTSIIDNDEEEDDAHISEDDLQNLRRVSGKIPWQAYTIAFCELCERFSYYGSTVVYVNFIQQPLPEGSTTGSDSEQPGALGMGQRASTGLTTFNQFWAYVMPLLGAYLADAHLGRYKAIHVAIVFAMVGHIILTASAAPSVLKNPNSALGAFIIGLIVLGVGTGLFKSNISPLLAEQQKTLKKKIVTLKSGERVIVDPAVTTARMFLWFYVCINIGSLVGQIGMVFAEKYVGFWLSYLLPTILFICCPVVLAVCKKRYRLTPPTGSVLSKFFKMWTYAMKGRWSVNPVTTYKNFHAPDFWDKVKPSQVPVAARPAWMTYDDAWVEEVRRGLMACAVFLYMPLYWLAYGQMTNNLVSQAAVMQRHGVPNDIIQNLNPISIIILIPLMDFVVYPAFRKAKIQFTPIKRMTTGFFFASTSMVAACVTQYYIYQKSECGNYASGSLPNGDSCPEAPINVWVQALPYVFVGISEIFTNVTSLEYAFTKAPNNMRSLVMSINLLMNAFSSAIMQAFVSLSADPLLVWNYGVVAVLAGIAGVAFWLNFRHLDKEEDRLNMLEQSAYRGKRPGSVSAPAGNEPDDTKQVVESTKV